MKRRDFGKTIIAAGAALAANKVFAGPATSGMRSNFSFKKEETPVILEVAINERHAYGSITLTSDILGATASVEPLEDSHWPELARRSSLPILLWPRRALPQIPRRSFH